MKWRILLSQLHQRMEEILSIGSHFTASKWTKDKVLFVKLKIKGNKHVDNMYRSIEWNEEEGNRRRKFDFKHQVAPTNLTQMCSKTMMKCSNSSSDPLQWSKSLWVLLSSFHRQCLFTFIVNMHLRTNWSNSDHLFWNLKFWQSQLRISQYKVHWHWVWEEERPPLAYILYYTIL